MATTKDRDLPSDVVISRMRGGATTDWARRCVRVIDDLQAALDGVTLSRDKAVADGASDSLALTDARGAVKAMEDDVRRLRAHVVDVQAKLGNALSARDDAVKELDAALASMRDVEVP